MKSRTVGAELIHADTDMTKLTVTFRNFANASLNHHPGTKFHLRIGHEGPKGQYMLALLFP